jgi:hypothetical protein
VETKFHAAAVLEKVDYEMSDSLLVLLNDFLERWLVNRLVLK